MLLDLPPLVFFGGKGGVGKTTTAAAVALALSEAGRKVLLVSTDPAHNLGHLWGVKIGDQEYALNENLSVCEIDPALATTQHLEQARKVMYSMMPERLHKEVDRHLALSASTPGAHEAAILERLADLINSRAERGYEHVIVDTAPSGHTAHLLDMPELMGAWTEGLLQRRAQSEKFGELVRGFEATGKDKAASVGGSSPVERRNNQIRHILLRRKEKFAQLRHELKHAGCVIVLVPERLPVLESLEFKEELARIGVPVAGYVVNRCSPTDQGEFLAARHEREEEFIAQLRRGVGDAVVLRVPLLATEVHGDAGLREYAEALGFSGFSRA